MNLPLQLPAFTRLRGVQFGIANVNGAVIEVSGGMSV
jgi:hypothetical protein